MRRSMISHLMALLSHEGSSSSFVDMPTASATAVTTTAPALDATSLAAALQQLSPGSPTPHSLPSTSLPARWGTPWAAPDKAGPQDTAAELSPFGLPPHEWHAVSTAALCSPDSIPQLLNSLSSAGTTGGGLTRGPDSIEGLNTWHFASDGGALLGPSMGLHSSRPPYTTGLDAGADSLAGHGWQDLTPGIQDRIAGVCARCSPYIKVRLQSVLACQP